MVRKAALKQRGHPRRRRSAGNVAESPNTAVDQSTNVTPLPDFRLHLRPGSDRCHLLAQAAYGKDFLAHDRQPGCCGTELTCLKVDQAPGGLARLSASRHRPCWKLTPFARRHC